MASVAVGSKLVLHGGRVPLILRSTRMVELIGGWSVPVLGDVTALQAAGMIDGPIVVEFPTEFGPVRLDAELFQSDDRLVLRAPGLRVAALIEQRRENVRGVVQLPVRGALLSIPTTLTRSQAVAEVEAPDVIVLEGVTATVSAGGISADLKGGAAMVPGARIYLELGLPGGNLAPAVMDVIDQRGPRVRASFVDISPLDRERLVRLVFKRQRAELADRRRSAEAR